MSQTPLKPLPSAPPTLEDSDIWLSIVVGYGLDWATAGVIFRDADRRDADAMYRWEADRLTVHPSHRNPIEWIETAMAIYKFSGPFR